MCKDSDTDGTTQLQLEGGDILYIIRCIHLDRVSIFVFAFIQLLLPFLFPPLPASVHMIYSSIYSVWPRCVRLDPPSFCCSLLACSGLLLSCVSVASGCFPYEQDAVAAVDYIAFFFRCPRFSTAAVSLKVSFGYCFLLYFFILISQPPACIMLNAFFVSVIRVRIYTPVYDTWHLFTGIS